MRIRYECGVAGDQIVDIIWSLEIIKPIAHIHCHRYFPAERDPDTHRGIEHHAIIKFSDSSRAQIKAIIVSLLHEHTAITDSYIEKRPDI